MDLHCLLAIVFMQNGLILVPLNVFFYAFSLFFLLYLVLLKKSTKFAKLRQYSALSISYLYDG